MSTNHNHHERFDARTTSVERAVLVIMWLSIVAAIMVSFYAIAPKPHSQVDAYPRTACQMVCPGATLAGVCTVPKIPWRPPYICVPSNY